MPGKTQGTHFFFHKQLLIVLTAVAAVSLTGGVSCHDTPGDGPPADVLKNTLAGASSAYLRSAAHQPVFWQEWSPEAFELARRLNRLVLLDIGAIWCHWCHVMDRESYENQEIADIINENYIAIKVDRDDRPDIDTRYQAAVQVLTRQGGWPLTCILTPDGNLLFGGTYFPPDDRDGKPGLKSILPRVLEAYRSDPEKAESRSQSLVRHIEDLNKKVEKPGELYDITTQWIVNNIEISFDRAYGGFGTGVKFPNIGAVELALAMHDKTGKKALATIVEKTLRSMADGGLHDQLGGGFHRYTVDRKWRIPHFEKLMISNAGILKNYLHAYQMTGDSFYRDVAEDIIAYSERVMTDRENGGFYAAQDADVGMDDDGSYYTWTKAEIEDALTPEEAQVVIRYYGVTAEPGALTSTPDRNILHVATDIGSLAEELDLPTETVKKRLERARSRLLEKREARPAPFIDKTLYASVNGAMISAYIDAAALLHRDDLKAFALKTLDFLLDTLYSKRKGFAHSAGDLRRDTGKLLVDQVWMAGALLDGFELSGSVRYLDTARDVMDFVLKNFEDKDSGGFLDRTSGDQDNAILAIPHKPLRDAPAASNSLAVRVLDRLFALTDDKKYSVAARRTLSAFAGSMHNISASTAFYGLALLYHLTPPPQVVIVGSAADSAAEALYRTAVNVYRPGKEVYWFDPDRVDKKRLPAVVRMKMAGTNLHESAVAFVCAGNACAPPAASPDRLAETITSFGR